MGSLYLGMLGILLAMEESVRALINYALGYTISGWTSLIILNQPLTDFVLQITVREPYFLQNPYERLPAKIGGAKQESRDHQRRQPLR